MPKTVEAATETAPLIVEDVLTPGAEAQVPLAPESGLKAVVIVGNHRIPTGKDLVIVVEERSLSADKTASVAKLDGYPKGANVYLRSDAAVQFPEPAEGGKVLTMGEDVFQENFWGFTRQINHINVGPAHLAFGAANLAYQLGASEIEIIGLSADEKERLAPFLADVATNQAYPIEGVTLTVA